jgi:signal transduction histidine kinase
VKHSSASCCSIQFFQKGKTIVVTVEDNGKGFDINSVNRNRNGLQNLTARAKQLNGEFKMESKPEGGSTAKFSVHI